MKKITIKEISLFAIVVLFAVFFTFRIVGAFSGTAETVMENVTIQNFKNVITEKAEDVFGGLLKYGMHIFPDGIDANVYGGEVLTKTGTTTLTAMEVCEYEIINMDPQQATGVTLTLPATSTLFKDCFGKDANHKTILVQNTADASEVFTLVAGTGVDLQEPDGQNVVIGQNNYAILDIWKTGTDGEVVVVVDETIPAD